MAGVPFFLSFLIVSIAVSARIAPSRRLRAALLLFAGVQLAAALAVLLCLSSRLPQALLCAAFFLVAALCLLVRASCTTKVHQIDVSGAGGLRLTVQQKMESGSSAANGIVVTLLPASLIWPQLMLLHLAEAHGRKWCIAVLRDSLPALEYRALRVALSTVGARAGVSATTKEIA